MKILLRISLLVTVMTLSSCSILSSKKVLEPIDYLNNTVKMDLKQFFNGNIEAFSIKQDKNGKIIGTETIKIEAQWDKNKGVIKKSFYSNKGKKDNRTWLITLESDGTFNAVGHDVGTPAKGKQIGNAAQSTYSLMLKGASGKQEVLFEDRMYLVNKNSMIIISNFRQKKPSGTDNNNSSGKYIISLKKAPSVKKKSFPKKVSFSSKAAFSESKKEDSVDSKDNSAKQ